MPTDLSERRVLITGAGGYLGSETLRFIADNGIAIGRLIAMDVRDIAQADRIPNAEYIAMDIRSPDLKKTLAQFEIQSVVHLVSVVSPGKRDDREFLHSVDVAGTENLLQACVGAGVEQIILTSSGAAYGYYPDNPVPLTEDDALRGNPEFAYSDHKRLVEEMLARYRKSQPALKQLILRPCTILGATTDNQITAMFRRKRIMGIRGASLPFVFIWDQDVAECIVRGLQQIAAGIYNVAGSGSMTLPEIATALNKPYIGLPSALVKSALWILKRLGATSYGPEQVNFLRYRPVLSNARLIEEFGYTPHKTSREAFEYYWEHNGKKG